MSKQVPWNKYIVERFVELAMLTKDEEMILRTRVAGWSRVKQSMERGMSLSTVDRIIARLKQKYDGIQKFDPLLPPRESSEDEDRMDMTVS